MKERIAKVAKKEEVLFTFWFNMPFWGFWVNRLVPKDKKLVLANQPTVYRKGVSRHFREIELFLVFSELAPRPMQSVSCNVHLFVYLRDLSLNCIN